MNSTILVVVAYITAQILADIAVLKFVLIGGMTAGAGILIYPITFTLRDMAHKILGRKGTRTLILAAGAANLCMAALFWIITRLPYARPDAPDWNGVLGPVWRIVLASIVAEIVAELLDTEMYHLWITKITTRYQWARVMFSNSLALPVDALVFVWLAFGGLFPAAVVWSIFASNLIAKAITTVVGSPLIYLVKERNVDGDIPLEPPQG